MNCPVQSIPNLFTQPKDFNMKKKSKATIAIITRTKDRPILLKRALKSVSMQDIQDYIHIIVNDGGNESVVCNLIQQLPASQQEKILYLCNKTSIGMEASSNRAIQESHSEYIAMLDDDDTWEPNFLATTISHLNNHQDVMGIATKCNYIQEEIHNNKVRILNSRPFKAYINTHSLYDICKENNILNHSFVYRRSALTTVGLYDETLSVLGDWDFNLRFLQHFDIPIIPLRLANYHVRVTNSSYGNTITKGTYLHKQTRMKINNRELRKDLLTGTFGIGYLINSAPHTIKLSVDQKIINFYFKISDRIKIIYFFRIFFPKKHVTVLRKRFYE
jgi:GT2 family glycosyltransferase